MSKSSGQKYLQQNLGQTSDMYNSCRFYAYLSRHVQQFAPRWKKFQGNAMK